MEDIRYTFDERQAMEATAYLLGLNGGQMNYTKTIKLLYLSDREALSRGLGSITTDIYKSLNLGPVTSSIYDCIKYKNGKIWNQYIRRKDKDIYTIELIAPPDFEMLSIGARKILKGIYDKFREYGWRDVVNFCHSNLPEWENPHGSSMPISIESILDASVEPEDIFGYRIKALTKKPEIVDANWASLDEADANLDRLYGKTEDMDTRRLDAAASLYVQSRKPIWHMYSVRSEASAMIRNAKLSDEDLHKYAEEARKGIYIKAESGVLYNTVTELLAIGNSIYLATSIGGLRMYAYRDNCEDGDFGFPAAMLALMACENRPIEMREPDVEKVAKSGGKITGGVIRRQISLSKRYYSLKRAPGRKAMDKDGKVLTVVNVSGFVRNQPYGKGRTEYKKIWIDGFQRGQWVNSGLSYVTVRK